jgi:hypothetical protein
MLIHNRKAEIKQGQRQQLIKHGFGKNSRDIDKQATDAFFKMAEESKEDLNAYIEFEKDYVECNQRLIQLRLSSQ